MPADATTSAWFWLLISGLFGFVLGDLFLFEAFVEIAQEYHAYNVSISANYGTGGISVYEGKIINFCLDRNGFKHAWYKSCYT